MRPSRAMPDQEKPVRGKLLTMEEAEEKIGMSREWMYKHMKKGTLPFPWFLICVGKRLIDSADLEDYLRVCKIPTGSRPA